MDIKSLLMILLLIWIVGYVILYFKEFNHLSNVESFENNIDDDTIEGFTSTNDTYNKCREKGYTNDFCLSAANPGECITPSGLKGVLSKNFRGIDGSPLCVVNEKIENELIGIGDSSRDPSIIVSKHNGKKIRRKLKWKDITTAKDIESGPRHGYNIYKHGIDKLNRKVEKVEAANVDAGIWDRWFNDI